MAADLASRPAVVPVLPVAHLRHLIGIARALRQERHACLAMDMSAVGAIANVEVTGGSSKFSTCKVPGGTGLARGSR